MNMINGKCKSPETLSDIHDCKVGIMNSLHVFPCNSKILFQGDSITDGNWGRNLDLNHILGHGYVFIIGAMLNARHPERNLTFINRGISGNTVRDLQDRWKADALDLNPDYLSILIGINDAGKGITPEDYELSYDKLLSDTVAVLPGIRLILGEPFQFPGDSDDMKKRQKIVARLSVKYHAALVKYQHIFDNACAQAPAKYWIWDGIHPTCAGHQLMADEWMRTVSLHQY